MGAGRRKKTLSLLLRGYVNGGYYLDASETLVKMLDLGICPYYLDRIAVLQGLDEHTGIGKHRTIHEALQAPI